MFKFPIYICMFNDTDSIVLNNNKKESALVTFKLIYTLDYLSSNLNDGLKKLSLKIIFDNCF